MNKLALLLGFVLCLGLVSAQVMATRVGSIDDECQEFGFDEGVAKWQCDDNVWDIDEEKVAGTSVTGTCDVANWDVGDSGATGIVVKAGSTVHYGVEGTSGQVQQSQPSTSHITFCKDRPSDEVPEFGLLGLGAVVAVLALYLFKR